MILYKLCSLQKNEKNSLNCLNEFTNQLGYTQYFKKLFLVLATGDRKIYDTGISSRIYDAVGEKRPTYMKNN